MATPKRGQGLGALLSRIDSELTENPKEVVTALASNVAEIPLNQIEPNSGQPRVRFDEEALGELAESIRVHGIIQPITVRRLSEGKYQIISGERRWRASQRAGLTNVPAYIRVANDQELLEMALVENIQRQDLDPIEVAITYSRLKEECKLTDEVLSDRVGKKRSTVTNYMGLLKLPYDIQEGLRANLLSMGHARALIGLHDFALQSALYKEIITKGLSVRQVEELAAGYGKPKERKEAAPKLPQEYQAVQKRLVSALGAKVALKVDDKGKGQITVNFNDTEELNRLLELMEKDA